MKLNSDEVMSFFSSRALLQVLQPELAGDLRECPVLGHCLRLHPPVEPYLNVGVQAAGVDGLLPHLLQQAGFLRRRTPGALGHGSGRLPIEAREELIGDSGDL